MFDMKNLFLKKKTNKSYGVFTMEHFKDLHCKTNFREIHLSATHTSYKLFQWDSPFKISLCGGDVFIVLVTNALSSWISCSQH
jgi:hypothetical protein